MKKGNMEQHNRFDNKAEAGVDSRKAASDDDVDVVTYGMMMCCH